MVMTWGWFMALGLTPYSSQNQNRAHATATLPGHCRGSIALS
jgi:hypothetical protein